MIVMNEIKIRKALPKDLDSISAIKLSGWQTSYKDIVDKQYLDSLTIGIIKDSILKYDLNSFFVAEYKTEIAGFCRFSDYQAQPDEEKIDCELKEIYVLPNLKRMGIGTLLFNSVIAYFKSKNKAKMCLGCFKKNISAITFYEKIGGNISDERQMNIGDSRYPIILYTFNISA